MKLQKKFSHENLNTSSCFSVVKMDLGPDSHRKCRICRSLDINAEFITVCEAERIGNEVRTFVVVNCFVLILLMILAND